MNAHVRRSLIALGFAGVSLWAQPNPNAAANADKEWGDLQKLARAVPLARQANGNAKTADERKNEIKQQAADARKAAAAARDFYTQHPNDPRAAEARKIEAIKAVRGVEAGNKAQEESAMAVAKTFRQNTGNPVADRFDVALAMDRVAHGIKIKEGTATGRIQDWENLGKNLRTELGDTPALGTYFVELAERADTESGVRLANTVMLSTVATNATKARAQVILDRAALIGTSLNLKLTKLGGGELDFAQQKNKVTVIIACNPSDLSSLATVKRFEKAFPTDAQFVYVAVAGHNPGAKKVQGAMPLAGTVCHAGHAQASRAMFAALKLPRGAAPQVYVLNRAGALSATGGVNELPNLVAKAAL